MEVVLDGSQQLLGSVHQETSVANDCKHMCLRRTVQLNEAEKQALVPNTRADLLEPTTLIFVCSTFNRLHCSVCEFPKVRC